MQDVTPQNYAQHAHRTEMVPDKAQLVASEPAFVTACALKCASDLGEQLDKIKRAVFYGQVIQWRDVLDQLPDCRLSHGIGPQEIKPEDLRLLHAALGLMTEAIEFSEAVFGHIFDGKEIDKVHLKEELGDLFWYTAIPVNLFGWTYEDVMAVNIAKLRARYPGKWSQDAAFNRDLVGERAVLETPSVPPVPPLSPPQ